MPMRALRPCNEPGCAELIRDGRYCSTHNSAHIHNGTQQERKHPERQRLYDRHWQRRRELHLAKYPWCEDCLLDSIYVPATEVHHEERHQGNKVIFISSSLRSLCKRCHSRRTIQEVRGG